MTQPQADASDGPSLLEIEAALGDAKIIATDETLPQYIRNVARVLVGLSTALGQIVPEEGSFR